MSCLADTSFLLRFADLKLGAWRRRHHRRHFGKLWASLEKSRGVGWHSSSTSIKSPLPSFSPSFPPHLSFSSFTRSQPPLPTTMSTAVAIAKTSKMAVAMTCFAVRSRRRSRFSSCSTPHFLHRRPSLTLPLLPVGLRRIPVSYIASHLGDHELPLPVGAGVEPESFDFERQAHPADLRFPL
jgi:hypothetical protein